MKSSLNENKNKSAILQRFMEAKKHDSQFAGIYGRLGDLGTIDGKYDCAISTACSFLDHIVVDTVNTGQLCMTYLRENKIG